MTGSMALAACGGTVAPSSNGAPAADRSGTRAAALRGDVTLLGGQINVQTDPHKINGEDNFFMKQIFSTLVDLNPTPRDGKGRWIPGLATSWAIADDARSVTFDLRPNVKFHDGDTLTAEDVQFSVQRAINPDTKNPYASSFLGHIQGLTILSPTKVRLDLNNPDLAILDETAARLYIVSKRQVTELGEKAFDKPIGTGPMKFVSFAKGQQSVWDANEAYWDGVPSVKRATWKEVPDINARISSILAGQADIAENMLPNLVPQLEAAGKTVLRGFTGQQRFIYFNSQKFAAFKDRRVRYAINIAVNREEILKTIFAGGGRIVAGPLSPFQAGAKESGVSNYPFDPAQAKQLLNEAGYPNGFNVELLWTAGRYVGEPEMLQAIAGYLAKIGIKVELQAREYGTWQKAIAGKSYPGMATFSKGNAEVSDSPSAISRHLISGSPYAAHTNPQVDALYKEGLSVSDPAKLTQIYAKVQQTEHDDPSQLYLFDEPQFTGLGNRVKWDLNLPMNGSKISTVQILKP